MSYADQDPERCATAEALGADVHQVGDWPRRLGRAAIVVETPARPKG